jgi:hypothetical protein
MFPEKTPETGSCASDLRIQTTNFLLTAGHAFGNNNTMITNSYSSFTGFSFWCGFFFRPSTRVKGLA